MPKIQFKRTCLIEGQEERSFIQVPKIGTQHCDMLRIKNMALMQILTFFLPCSNVI